MLRLTNNVYVFGSIVWIRNKNKQAPKLSVVSARPTGVTARRGVCVHAASTETLSKVQGIIAEQLGTDVEKIGSDVKFVDLGADSLDTVEIMMALEEEFDITLDEEGKTTKKAS